MARRKRHQGDPRFGERLLKLRKDYRRTQADVAKTMRIHPDTLRKFEQGHVLPDWPDDVQNLCAAIGLRTADAESLKTFYHSITARKTATAVPLVQRPLLFARQETEFIIIDSLGDEAVPPQNITLMIDWERAEIPSVLRQFYDRYLFAVERRKSEGDLQTPYDGEIFSIKTITKSRTPGTELPVWSIALKKNSYYQYAALARNLDDEYNDAGRNTTMRHVYFQREGFDPSRPPEFLNIFGISMAVHLTKDNRLVFVKKGATEIYPRALGAAVAEGILSAHGDVSLPGIHEKRTRETGESLIKCAIRGAQEELGLTITPEMITFLALAFNRNASEYSVIGLISVDLSWEELQQTVLMARDARFEITQLYSIAASPMSRVYRELFDQTMQANTFWAPMAFGTLIIALRFLNQKTYARYDRMLAEEPEQFGDDPPPYGRLIPFYPPLISR